MTREFLRTGTELQKEPLHYTMCGLDDVYLLSGFRWKATPHGEGLTISDVDGLHKAIGLSLVTDRKVLAPKELRFLRREMNMTQDELAGDLRLSGQQVARWEKGECEISGPAELALRFLYVMQLVPARKRNALLNKLTKTLHRQTKTDETRTQTMVFEETDDGWAKTAFLPPAHVCHAASV